MNSKISRLLDGSLGNIFMPTLVLQKDALEILKKIRAINVEGRQEATKRCWRWLLKEKSTAAAFAVQASCEYLVADEKQRNALIEKYNGLRAKLLLRKASVKKLPTIESTCYSKIPVDRL